MFSRLHSKFGTAGLVVSIVALVAALSGAAIAANGALTGKQKKEVKKIAKTFAGKDGAAGPAGPQGPKGDAGAAGAAGKDGTNGTPGAPGQSVTGAPVTAGGACGPETGVKYTLGATSTNVCNGEDGEDGETGFTDTLPQGKTETGVWGLNGVGGRVYPLPSEEDPEAKVYTEQEILLQALSFSIPIGQDEVPGAIVYMDGTGSAVDCPGSVTEPKATPGKVCVYPEGNIWNLETEPLGIRYRPALGGGSKIFASGAILPFRVESKGKFLRGTFAVMPGLPTP